MISITNKMKTRSQTAKNILTESVYLVDIDFDDASACWHANKKACKNGMYEYICVKTKANGKKCGRVCYADSEFCWQHRSSKK